MVELPRIIKMCTHTLEYIRDGNKGQAGLSFELKDWKPALDPRYAVAEHRSTLFDGILLPSYPVDAKLVFSNYFYMSHREYLYGLKNNTLFAAYKIVGEEAHLFAVYMFDDLKKAGLIVLYPEGRWVMCEQTGQKEPPWSVQVGPASIHNLL